MKIELAGFSGEAPKLDPRMLGEVMAQTARNCRFDRARIDPITELAAETAAGINATDKSLFKHDGDWIGYPEDRRFVSSPIAQDQWGRLYMTVAGSYPRLRDYLGAEYRLGIPRPPNAPTCTPATPVDTDDADSLLVAEGVYYVTTFVDAYGHEGPPSASSSRVAREINTDVTVTLPAAPSGNYNFGAGSLVRIYRSNQGTQDAAFQFVDEVPIGTTTYLDQIPNEELSEVLPTATWIGPPDDDTTLYPDGPMQGLIDAGNGVLAGFSGNTVCFCEPYLPHAWPLEYRLALTDRIVGLAPIPGGVLVATTGKPRILIGTGPSTYVEQTAEIDAPCVAAESIVDMGDFAIYASDEGLVAASATSVRHITTALLDRKSWASYSPETLRSAHHEGRYIGFYDGGAFTFDPNSADQRGAWVDLPDDRADVARYYQLSTGKLYLVTGSNEVSEWEPVGGAARTFTWRSREFHLGRANRFAGWRLDADAYPVTLNVYDGTSLVTSITATEELGRLPSVRIKDPVLELTGTSAVHRVAIATSMGELVDA